MRLHLPILLTSLVFFAACQKPKLESQRPFPLEQDPFIQVYFNHNQSQGADYKEPYRQLTRPGDNLEQLVVDAISSATSTVDIAIQELRLPKIAQALVQKHQAGVKVRVIIDNSYNRPWSDFIQQEVDKLDTRKKQRYQEFISLADRNGDGKLSEKEIYERDALIILRRAGVPVLDDTADGSQGTGLMHHKFLVVDGYTVVTGSANFTSSGIHGDFNAPESRGNANHLVQIKDTRLANILTEEFNLMWGDGLGGKSDSKFGLQKKIRKPQHLTIGETKVTVQFSPSSPSKPWSYSSNGLISNTLASATDSINLALFVFTEQNLVNSLEVSHRQGVKISALIDPSFAFRYYSEALDLLGVALSSKCKYEPDNSPWQNPLASVGIPQLARGDKLHHKFAVVDKQIVITGSHNWSNAANHQNDELVLVLENPTIAAHFTREFNRLNQNAILGLPVAIQQKITEQEQSCIQITTTSSTDDLAIGLINLNTANQKELEKLPGIGSQLAKRIITTRQHQPFTSLEDLERVSGIGSSIRQKLDGRVTW